MSISLCPILDSQQCVKRSSYRHPISFLGILMFVRSQAHFLSKGQVRGSSPFCIVYYIFIMVLYYVFITFYYVSLLYVHYSFYHFFIMSLLLCLLCFITFLLGFFISLYLNFIFIRIYFWHFCYSRLTSLVFVSSPKH